MPTILLVNYIFYTCSIGTNISLILYTQWIHNIDILFLFEICYNTCFESKKNALNYRICLDFPFMIQYISTKIFFHLLTSPSFFKKMASGSYRIICLALSSWEEWSCHMTWNSRFNVSVGVPPDNVTTCQGNSTSKNCSVSGEVLQKRESQRSATEKGIPEKCCPGVPF